MRLRRLTSLVTLVIAVLVVGTAAAAAGPTKVSDDDTDFHRLYVTGCPDNEVEGKAFADDLGQIGDALDDHQGEGSTAKTLDRPSVDQLKAAIEEIKQRAQPGDEITFVFVGHGSGSESSGATDTGGELNDPYDESIVLDCASGETGREERVSDDEMADMFEGLRAGVTLVLIMNSCWGGGFTGGSDDLVESDDVTVIGPKGTCPGDYASLPTPSGGYIAGTETRFLHWLYPDTLAEDVADISDDDQDADANGDGVITGDELRDALADEGWDLGAPDDLGPNDKKLKKGKSLCKPAPGGSCSVPFLVPDQAGVTPGGTVTLEGRNFAPRGQVVLELAAADGTRTALGVADADDTGSFTHRAVLDVEAAGYLIDATDEDGFQDWIPMFVVPYGGVFGDDDGSVHEPFIDVVALEHITTGCDPDAAQRYCPGQDVTRAQMATFIQRSFDVPPATEGHFFGDVEDSVHQAAIDAVAEAGITSGCGPERYCPAEVVSRAQMASFLVRALEFAGVATASVGDAFDDDDGSVHEDNIDAAHAAGITTGCRDGAYCPGDGITRAQLATFLGRALGLPAVTQPAPRGIDIDGDGEDEQVRDDPTRPAGRIATGHEPDGDQDVDVVDVGTAGGGRVVDGVDLDGDGDEEIIVDDPTNPPGRSDADTIDGDLDPDAVWVGTSGGGRVKDGSVDIDGDGEGEAVIEDPTIEPGDTRVLDIDGDGDADLIWVGTAGGATCETADTDGDGEPEIVVHDPERTEGSTAPVDLDGDGDPDLVVRGTGAPDDAPPPEEPDDGPPPPEVP